MIESLNGATRLHVIVGDPIAQVKSPAGVTRAFVARGHNAMVPPIHVTSQDLPAFLRGADVARNIDGIIVTVPHKFACYRHCTSATGRAQFLQAVNVMRRTRDGGWHGEMLDGVGFLGAIEKNGARPRGARALLIGAGGAGTAIALALVEAGVRELAIHDADTTRRDALIARLTAKHDTPVVAGSADPSGFDLVAHATPAGMKPDDPLPVMVERLSPTTFVGCVITAPVVSPLIAAARQVGCPTSTGADMYAAEQDLIVDFLLAPAN